MRAAIDIGTNSVRLLVAESTSGQLKPIVKELQTTRLGEGVSQSGRLSSEAMDRTVEALAILVQHANTYTTQITAVATSAVRDAANKEKFLALCREHASIDVCVLSGEAEAQLSYAGALLGQDAAGECTLLDIGGGSTELAYGAGAKLIRLQSYNVGAVRLSEMFTAGKNGIVDVISINDWLTHFWYKQQQWPQNSLRGVGGTITSLAAIAQELTVYDSQKVNNYCVSFAQIEAIMYRLALMTLKERKQVVGLQPARADIICYGLAILHSLMNWLEANEIVVSEQDILEGIIFWQSNNSVLNDNI